MAISVRESEELVLQRGKVVTVKPITRNKNNGLAKDGSDIFTGCMKGITLAFDINTRSYKSPFTKGKEADEQEAFEKLLHQEEGALNLYTFKQTEPNFWGDFRIRIPKEGVKLDLGTPNGMLMYKILSVDSKVAGDGSQTTDPSKVFQIFDEDKEKKVVSNLAKKKSKAYKYIAQATKTKTSLINTLKLLDKRPDPTADKEWLEGELYKITDQTQSIKGIAGIDKFIEVMEDPTSNIRLFVIEAIEGKEVVRDKMGYKSVHNNEFIGKDHKEVLQYFLSKDPKVQESKLIIQDRIK